MTAFSWAKAVCAHSGSRATSAGRRTTTAKIPPSPFGKGGAGGFPLPASADSHGLIGTFPTPIFGQKEASGQIEQCGETGLQRFWPNVTSRSLYVIQWRRGRLARRAFSVSSGVLVLTYPQRFEIRWTCVSTQMPGFPYPTVTTRFAVFRPTPLRVRRSSIVSGTLPAESADEIGADLSEMAGLGLVEADGIDRPGDRRHGKPEHLGGGLCDLPEPGRRFGRRAVLGAERKDAGHEHPKGVARLLCHHADDRRLPLPDLPAEKQERPQDVEGSASGSVSGPGMPLPGPASLRLGSRGAHVPASATSTKLRRRAP